MNISRRSAMKLVLSVGAVASFFGVKSYVENRKGYSLIKEGNLNNYISKGDFSVSGIVSNAPTKSGFLKVDVFGDNGKCVIQQFFDEEDPRILMIRRRSNGGDWSGWGSPVSNNQLRFLDKKIICLGDSITGSFDWPQKLQKQLVGNVSNFGISGTTAADVHGDFGFLSLCKISEAINDGNWVPLKDAAIRIRDGGLGQDYTKTIDGLAGTDWSTVDYVIISFGTNDYGKNVPIGNDDLSQKTFKGSFNYSIEKITKRNPNIQILTSTPLWRIKGIVDGELKDSDSSVNSEGVSLIDYVDSVISTSRSNKIPYIDLYRKSGINKLNYEHFFIDGLHPSEFGTDRISEKISSFILSNY
ncbi:GDSL-like Lipase/Acylhydrolase [Yersinia intermedia]|uniref:SGNH/GDSL hydrolase family protein n=1 Tax=Yersinia intermedia TaxID=631 RepID=UPI0005E50381|nr:SGNH/GDSL hydrolase family protein [Yersinia intermedia]CNI83744.1 GDSL-like Lipase/Acylhydrolase [Yersinia intermedia]